MPKISSTKDLIMALLYAKGPQGECHPIYGKTRLMKMIFLFEHELKKEFNKKTLNDSALTKFEAYDYGPYSAGVYDDMEFLINNGFIKAEIKKSPTNDGAEDEIEIGENEGREAFVGIRGAGDNPNVLNTFSLTELGKEFVQSQIELSTDQWAALSRFKTKCVQTSLKSLLKYVYTKYPDMATKSKIKERYGF